jgi:CRP/FNR family transcriptional regulator
MLMNGAGLDWGAIPFFAGLNSDSLSRIDRAAAPRRFPAGAMIFGEGECCAGFYIAVDGLVRLYRVNVNDGRLHTLSLLRAPATFNEVAAVDGGENPFNAAAVTAVDLRVIPHEALISLLASDRALLTSTVQTLARLNRDYIERLEDMTFRTIPSRLARLFLHEASYAGQIAELPSQLTQEEIASILGTTREVVGRALRGLMNAGLLRKHGRSFTIVDRDGLHALAEMNTLPDPKI